MRKEFKNLVALLQKVPYSNDVAIAIQELESKIDEIEKRMHVATLCAKDVKTVLGKFTESVDQEIPFIMKVNEHDSIITRADDIEILMDLKDNMCVVDNWHNLFCEDKEPSPIAVGKVEYDFPEEVYTIGNADNTEIIGDVYESDFIKLLDLGMLICESDSAFPIGEGNKTNYVVRKNEFIIVVKNRQIDLSKVPIKREVFMTFESSWGEITCDKCGNVIEVTGDEEYNGERNYLFDIATIDLVEYESFLKSIDQELDHDSDDILSVGFWKKDNTYNEADKGWRKNMFSPEDDEDEAPTMLCQDEGKYVAVKDIISKLKGIEVDGETMEYILDQVGMLDQVAKQLGLVNF
jgi:hypothetical protein